jgi:hypothetical protein
MKRLLVLATLLWNFSCLRTHGESPVPRNRPSGLPVANSATLEVLRPGTMSIIARDPQTGELGVAVESHYFSVGPVCPWAEAGVGAVATQAMAEPL